jgi:nucleolar protein 4
MTRAQGYAFAEFNTHEAALAALKGTNNRADLFGEDHRLIVEFAVENALELKRIRERKGLWRLMRQKPMPWLLFSRRAARAQERALRKVAAKGVGKEAKSEDKNSKNKPTKKRRRQQDTEQKQKDATAQPASKKSKSGSKQPPSVSVRRTRSLLYILTTAGAGAGAASRFRF